MVFGAKKILKKEVSTEQERIFEKSFGIVKGPEKNDERLNNCPHIYKVGSKNGAKEGGC